MVTETAFMSIKPGHEAEFEAAIAQARTLVEQTPGCRGLKVARGVERPSVYLVTISWDSLEDHLVGFRDSDRFPKWRALLSPHYSEPPTVEHWGDLASAAE